MHHHRFNLSSLEYKYEYLPYYHKHFVSGSIKTREDVSSLFNENEL